MQSKPQEENNKAPLCTSKNRETVRFSCVKPEISQLKLEGYRFLLPRPLQ